MNKSRIKLGRIKESIGFAKICENYLNKSESSHSDELIKIYLLISQASEEEKNSLMVLN